jgi:hypothetical protein
MKEFKEIASKLTKGDIKQAAAIRKKLSHDDLIEEEVTEIARQAVIFHLRHGEIEKAIEIKKYFPMDSEVLNQALKQAVVGCYCEGDLERMLMIKDGFPIPKHVRREIVDYCVSWGRKKEELVLQAVFMI